MMTDLPKDPVLCLSVVNTKLRDCYATLDELCLSMNINKELLISKFKMISYEYDSEQNQFI